MSKYSYFQTFRIRITFHTEFNTDRGTNSIRYGQQRRHLCCKEFLRTINKARQRTSPPGLVAEIFAVENSALCVASGITRGIPRERQCRRR